MGVMNEERLTLYDGLIKTHITNITVAKEDGKGLSTNDYTTSEKNKLDGLNDTLLNKLGEASDGSLTYNGNEIKAKTDSELSLTSENPVQNKIITGKLNEKADSMVYDEDNSKLKLMNGTTVLSEVTVSGGGSANGATIGVLTSESTLIGKEVVLSKDSATIKTGQFNVSGICTFSGIEDTGTYTVTATDGTDTTSEDVTVTTDDVLNKSVLQVTLTFVPDGATVTPTDDVGILLKCAEVKGTDYTTIAEVLTDDSAMYEITAHEESMKYLARSTSFADDLCADETFMTYLGSSAYVDATILNSDLWVEAIGNSTYFESVLNVKVPTMTSNTEPEGETITSGVIGNYLAYCAFDGIHYDYINSRWIGVHYKNAADVIGNWVGYKFIKPVCVKLVKILQQTDDGGFQFDSMFNTTVDLQGSNDNSNWETIKTLDLKASDYMTFIKYNIHENNKYYQYYRIRFNSYNSYDSNGGYYNTIISELQFYGRS